MHAAAILEIIRLSLEITLQLIKDMPPAQKAAAWERHQKNMDFWAGLGDLLIPPAKDPSPPGSTR